jgi:hypothetical protein
MPLAEQSVMNNRLSFVAASLRFSTCHVQDVMDAGQRPIVLPALEVTVQRTPGRQILRDIARPAFAAASYWQLVFSTYMGPLTTSLTSTARPRPPLIDSGA